MLGNGRVAVEMLNETLGIIENKFNEEVGCSVKTKHSDARGIILDYEGKFVLTNVLQYLPNGSLHKYNTGASWISEWRKCYEVIKRICEGLYYLHVKHRIVHLDLKPANILLDDNMVAKIADFGLPRCFDEKQCRAFTSNLSGTLGDMAPEFFIGKTIFQARHIQFGCYNHGDNNRGCLVGCLMKAKHKNIVRFLGYCADTHEIIGNEVRIRDVR